MKKKQNKRNAKKLLNIPVGILITDLVLWDFSQDERIIRHNVDQLAKAIQLGYNLQNFGASSFGISEEDLE